MNMERFAMLVAAGCVCALLVTVGCGNGSTREKSPTGGEGELGSGPGPRRAPEPVEAQPVKTTAAPIDGGEATADGGADGGSSTIGCTTLGRDGCLACCDIAYSGMDDVLRDTLGKCLCAQPGECITQCGSNYCA